MKHPRPYIDRFAPGTEPFSFEWDEWELVPYYNHDDWDRYDRLTEISIRGLVALTVASAEWVLARMRADQSGTDVEDFVEAAWAGMVHPAYLDYQEPEDDAYRGVQLGPLQIVIILLNDAIQLLNEDPDGARRAVWMFNLMSHLTQNPNPFQQWFDAVTERLRLHHPRPPESDADLFSQFPPGMGTPVPPEAFDLDRDYDRALDAQRIDAYLQALDWRRNRYLLSPDEVAAHEQFDQGTPYRYADS